jgi:hypothetical protein
VTKRWDGIRHRRFTKGSEGWRVCFGWGWCAVGGAWSAVVGPHRRPGLASGLVGRNRVTPSVYNGAMPIITYPRPTDRACSWCAYEFPVVRRPGRPRLYCRHACRQRAYEHRHGLVHQRTVRPLPAQARGETWTGTGYERSLTGLFAGHGKVHALRTSVRPEGRRRETLCGLLAAPLAGRHFDALYPRACATCVAVAAANPLRYGIAASNELARLRAMLDEVEQRRIDPAQALHWISTNDPLAA